MATPHPIIIPHVITTPVVHNNTTTSSIKVVTTNTRNEKHINTSVEIVFLLVVIAILLKYFIKTLFD